MTLRLPIKSILVVDDEQDIRDVLKMALEDAQYQVMLAENGQQAMQIFKQHHPAIVLTDIKMPVMDGIRLLRKIKESDPEVEVIMITGHGDMDLAINSLKNQATDFITKPINVATLEIALQRARDKIRTRQQLRAYTSGLEKLLREKTELQDHLAKLGLMIGSISHGLKGLLTGLDGGVYQLKSGLRTKNETRINDGYETVKLMAQRIRKMVMDILFYAKKREMQYEQVNLLDFANELASMVAPKLKNKAITMDCQFSKPPGNALMDAGYVQAALMNIIDNAIDACSKDKGKQRHHIEFGLRGEVNRIVFSVKDNGIGMDAETQDKLFTVFFSSKGRKGTGLGLFIANQIIKQHNGRIEVSSSPGRGSRFTIQLPRAPEKAGRETSLAER